MLKNNGFHNRHSPILRAFSPLSLFSGGAPGAWYDPSDFTTLFQNSAGTTPVTAVEQPVGRMLDKSGYGNHAFQATSASRPVLSARYNLLTKTEDFASSDWVKSGLTVSGTKVTAPNGTQTAETLVWASGSAPQLTRATFTTIPSGTPLQYTLYAKAGTKSSVTLIFFTDGSNFALCSFDLATGLVGTVASAGSQYTSITRSMTLDSNGFYRCVLSTNTNTLTTLQTWVRGDTMVGSGDNITIWGASLVPANQSTLPYQRVNTATDYATTGFLPYLRFDGVDDSLSTNSISFTSTDKMSVFAGVRKLVDQSNAMLVELSASVGIANPGSFNIHAPISTGANYASYLVGTGATPSTNTLVTTYTAPITNVVTVQQDIAASGAAAEIGFRINAVSNTGTSFGDAGTGNYGNYPLYIGRRNNASLPFNGQLYSMIIVGKAVTAGELSSTETYVNSKTGAY